MSTTLFVGDLSSCCSSDDIKQEFSKFGEITDIRIKIDPKTNKCLSYGFVEFQHYSDAQNALNALNGFVLRGRALSLSWASTTTTGMKQYEGQSGGSKHGCEAVGRSNSSVHVSFVTYKMDSVVTEETLRELFSVFGEVVDVLIKHKSQPTGPISNKGYGFVHFSDSTEGLESALNSVKALGNITINGVTYTSSVSHHLSSSLNGGITANTPPRAGQLWRPPQNSYHEHMSFNNGFSGLSPRQLNPPGYPPIQRNLSADRVNSQQSAVRQMMTPQYHHPQSFPVSYQHYQQSPPAAASIFHESPRSVFHRPSPSPHTLPVNCSDEDLEIRMEKMFSSNSNNISRNYSSKTTARPSCNPQHMPYQPQRPAMHGEEPLEQYNDRGFSPHSAQYAVHDSNNRSVYPFFAQAARTTEQSRFGFSHHHHHESTTFPPPPRWTRDDLSPHSQFTDKRLNMSRQQYGDEVLPAASRLWQHTNANTNKNSSESFQLPTSVPKPLYLPRDERDRDEKDVWQQQQQLHQQRPSSRQEMLSPEEQHQLFLHKQQRQQHQLNSQFLQQHQHQQPLQQHNISNRHIQTDAESADSSYFGSSCLPTSTRSASSSSSSSFSTTSTKLSSEMLSTGMLSSGMHIQHDDMYNLQKFNEWF